MIVPTAKPKSAPGQCRIFIIAAITLTINPTQRSMKGSLFCCRKLMIAAFDKGHNFHHQNR